MMKNPSFCCYCCCCCCCCEPRRTDCSCERSDFRDRHGRYPYPRWLYSRRVCSGRECDHRNSRAHSFCRTVDLGFGCSENRHTHGLVSDDIDSFGHGGVRESGSEIASGSCPPLPQHLPDPKRQVLSLPAISDGRFVGEARVRLRSLSNPFGCLLRKFSLLQSRLPTVATYLCGAHHGPKILHDHHCHSGSGVSTRRGHRGVKDGEKDTGDAPCEHVSADDRTRTRCSHFVHPSGHRCCACS